MSQELLVQSLFESLTSGDRHACRQLTQQAINQLGAQNAVAEVLWPTHELIEKFDRSEQLTTLSYHLATRLLRTLVDQTAAQLERAPSNGMTVFAMSGPTHSEELAGQMACDMLEAAGFEVTFAGGFQIAGDDTGGVPCDEVLGVVQDRKPDILLMFSSAARDLPAIRTIIDTIREIGATPNTQVVVGGGVFNRAEGLAEEIGADMYCAEPLEVAEVLLDAKMRALRSNKPATAKKAVAMQRRAVA